MPVLGKVGLVNKGTYNASTAYTALDFVKYNGSSFVALKGVQGVTPSDDGTNWAYLAKGVDVAVANSQTLTIPGTALDAVQANKNVNGSLAYLIDQEITSLNDSLATRLQFGIGSNGDKTSYPRAELRGAGSASSGTKAMAVRYYPDANNYTDATLCDKDGNLLPDYATKAELENLKNGTDNFTVIAMDPRINPISDDASKSVMVTGQAGNVMAFSAAVGSNALIQSQVYITDKYGAMSSRYRTRASENSAWDSWSSYGYFYPMRHKDISGTTDANGYISIDLDPDITLPVLGNTRNGGGSLSDRYVEFTPGSSSWWARVTYRGSAVASTAVKFRVWYFDAEQTLV